MPEHYRALVVILSISTLIFAFAKRPATALAMTKEDFIRRRNYWIYITIAGFLSPHFWIFIVAVGFLILRASKRENNNIALFFFLLLAFPQIRVEVPTFGIIGRFFSIDYLRLLTIILLLPVCLLEWRKKRKEQLLMADLFLIGYAFLNMSLNFLNDSFTGFLRSIPVGFVDVLIPYYAISRSVRDLKDFRESIMSFAIAVMLASGVGVFEFYKHWLLYSALPSAWDVGSVSGYLVREDYLRAIASSGQAIVFGYVIAVAIGLYLFLKHSVENRYFWWSGLALLIAGEISPLSKGPWLGVAVIVIVFLALNPQRITHAIKALIISPLIVLALLTTEAGTYIIGFLPFVGTVDTGSALYRQLLFDVSIDIILDNPFFGSVGYVLEMEELRQGQGIVDLVNTFLVIALRSGLIGLTLFVSFFAVVILNILRTMTSFQDNLELLSLGHSLIATIVGILVIIATVSPILHIGIIYMSTSALGVAYFLSIHRLKQDPSHRVVVTLGSQ